MQQTEVTLFCLELFSGMYCLLRKYSPRRKSGTVGQRWDGGLGPDLATWHREDVWYVRKLVWGRLFLVTLGEKLEKVCLWAQTQKWAVRACETGHCTKTVCIRNHFSVGMARERGCPSSETRWTLQTTRGSLAASSLGLSHVCFKGSYREQNRTRLQGTPPDTSFISEHVYISLLFWS